MLVTQVAKDLNYVFGDIIGEKTVTYTDPDPDSATYGQEVTETRPGNLFKEDLSNFTDVGRTISDSEGFRDNYDHYVGRLINRIGMTIIVNKSYDSQTIELEVNKFEYGALLQKIRVKDTEFQENPVWKLKKGESYDYFEYQPVEMSEVFWDQKLTFMTMWSWVAKTLKESVESLSKLLALYAAIENRIMTKMRITTDGVKQRAINELMAEQIMKGRQVNLLQEYITATGDTSVDAAHFLTSKAALQHSTVVLKKYKKFIAQASKIFNIGLTADATEGELNWTQGDALRMGCITDLDAALGTYLESEVYHNEFVKFSGYKEIAAWQGFDSSLDMSVRSSINVIPASEGRDTRTSDDDPDTRFNLMYPGIVFVMFDRSAAVVYNEDPELDVAPYNPKGKFLNYYWSWDCSLFVDLAENCVVFVISDYNPVTEEPADWGSGDYYLIDDTTGEYTQIVWTDYDDTPDFELGKYYVPVADPNGE